MIVLVMSKLMEEVSDWQKDIESLSGKVTENDYNMGVVKTLNLCIIRNIEALHKLSTIIPRGHMRDAIDKARLTELTKTIETIWDEHQEIRNLLSSYNLVKITEETVNGDM